MFGETITTWRKPVINDEAKEICVLPLNFTMAQLCKISSPAKIK